MADRCEHGARRGTCDEKHESAREELIQALKDEAKYASDEHWFLGRLGQALDDLEEYDNAS